MEPLAEALSHREAYPEATGTIEVVETHISWIFLTESWAYKVKKPLNLGFLDFSTLEKRRYYCNEELRLNQRLCPEIYHSVVPVVRSAGTFLIDQEGEIVDFAVKMVRFDRSMELDRLLAQQQLNRGHIDILGAIIAAFHNSLPTAGSASEFGLPDTLLKPVLANFTHTEPVASSVEEMRILDELKEWSIREHKRLSPLFLGRKREGFIRQCHGDMHTGNMVWWNNRIFIFDCIEFNEKLSIIDVISDLAFLFMDLKHGGEAGLAWRLLNNYLSETGDYGALPLLRFYTVYRAMVRAKVTAIRYAQTEGKGDAEKILEEHRSYIQLAVECSLPQKPLLVLTCGVSGSGKTTVSGALASELQGIHIRSDIERKRLAGLTALERSEKSEAHSIYSEEISLLTYQRLCEIAELCIEEGITVIVDATFIRAADRKRFMDLAAKWQCACRILRFQAPKELLMERVQKRFMRGCDASEADNSVLLWQLEKQEAFSAEEEAMTTEISTVESVDAGAIAQLLLSLKV